MKRLLGIQLLLLLLLGSVLPVYADELLWTKQAGQLICKELSEGLKLEEDTELSTIPDKSRFNKQLEPLENQQAILFGKMIRRCPMLTINAFIETEGLVKRLDPRNF